MGIHVLNEDLWDPKDLEIAKLKRKVQNLKGSIIAFKKYDEERKKYYSEVSQKIGELESYILELEHDNGLEELIRLNKEYKHQLNILTKKHYLSKVLEMSDTEVIELCAKVQLKQKIKSLQEDLIKERKSRDDLWSIIAKYRNKYGEL